MNSVMQLEAGSLQGVWVPLTRTRGLFCTYDSCICMCICIKTHTHGEIRSTFKNIEFPAVQSSYEPITWRSAVSAPPALPDSQRAVSRQTSLVVQTLQ